MNCKKITPTLWAMFLALLLVGAMMAAAQEDESEHTSQTSIPDSLPASPESVLVPLSAPFSSPRITLANFDVTYTYSKPDDLAEAIQTINDYLKDQGVFLFGDEQQGEFIIGGQTEGIYQVTGDIVTVSLNVGPGSSSSSKEFGFYFDKPRNMSRAVESLSLEISKHNGTLTGANLEQRGSFRASGVTGSYTVTSRVDVTITDKPWIYSEAFIEKKVKEWFKDM